MIALDGGCSLFGQGPTRRLRPPEGGYDAEAELSLGELEEVQASCYADDVPIEPSMVHWSLEQAKAFFESGGDVRPPVVEEAPASPERPLIKAEDLATPGAASFVQFV